MMAIKMVLEDSFPVFPEDVGKNDRVFVEHKDMKVLSQVGSRRGRPQRKVNEEKLAEVLRLYFVEKMSMRQVAEVLGVSHMSIYRMLSDPNVELLI